MAKIYGGVDAASRRGPIVTREDPREVRAFVREMRMGAYNIDAYMRTLDNGAIVMTVVAEDRMGHRIHEWNFTAEDDVVIGQ